MEARPLWDLGPRKRTKTDRYTTASRRRSRAYQVSFRHTPPPTIRKRAKDGQEGRVLLRVVVDEKWKIQMVGGHLSSGSTFWISLPRKLHTLGFSPAGRRRADRERVKIPVDFRWRDTKE